MTRKIYLCLAAVAACVIALCMGCSSDDDTFESNYDYKQKSSLLKSQLESLATEYGLCFTANEKSIEQQLRDRTFSIDSVKAEFKMMSQINGYYPFVFGDGNSIHFDSDRGRLSKYRKDLLPTRDRWSGSWQETVSTKHNRSRRYFAIYFTLEWIYNTDNHGEDKVYITSIQASPEYSIAEDLEDIHLSYQFIGALVSFNYSFECTVNSGLGGYKYRIDGNYSKTSGWATITGNGKPNAVNLYKNETNIDSSMVY